MTVSSADDFDKSESLLNMSLEDLLKVKISIASLNEETVNSAASSVIVYSRKEILRMGINRIEELLNYIPGVSTNRTQHNSHQYRPVFRGRFDGTGSGPGILLLFNGQRLNNAFTGGGFEYTPEISLEAIKQVEVIRGPGSAIYGSNAFNGVVNIITEPQKLLIKAGIGELNSKELSIQINQQIKDVSFDLYAHHYNDEGDDYPEFTGLLSENLPTDDPFENMELYLNLNYLDWHLSYRIFEKTYENFLLGDTQGNGINQLMFDNESIRIEYTGIKSANWTTTLFSEVQLQANDTLIKLINADSAAQLWWANGEQLDAIGGNDTRFQTNHSGIISKYSGLNNHLLNFGMDYRTEEIKQAVFQGNWDAEILLQSSGNTLVPSTLGIEQGFWFPGDQIRDDLFPIVSREVISLHIQDTWQLTDNINLTLGSRYDDYNDIGSAISNRLGLVYNISSTSTFKVLYGEAFRAPTIAEVYQLPTSVSVGNINLKPEEIKTIDISWQQKWDNYQFILGYYDSHITDQIDRVAVPGSDFGSTRLQAQNFGSENLSGWELELKANPIENLMISAGFTHLNQYSNIGVPVDPAYLIVNYTFNQWNFNLNGYYHGRVISRVDEITKTVVTLNSFFKLNAAISFQLTDDIELYLKAENMLDESYTTYDEFSQLPNGLPERGRIISIGTRISF